MNHAIKITLVLALPLVVFSQTKNDKQRRSATTPVTAILRPVLHKIRRQSNVPVFLPSKLPASINVNEIHLVDGEGKREGWEISLHYKAGCGDACFVGYFEAKRGEKVSRDEADKVVRLAKGVMGYYTARSCGGSCTPPQIDWVRGGVLYTIQFNVNNKTERQDEAELVALANSAILGGAR